MNGGNSRSLWQRYAGVYDFFMQKDKLAYDVLGEKICAQLNGEMDVLELACGTGLVTRRVANHCKRYTATDFADKMLEKAKRIKGTEHVRFEQADATQLLYADNSFDAVIIANALHIMPNPVEALQNIRRVLKPGGILIAPTFMRPDGRKASVAAKLLELFGVHAYAKWTLDSYLAFLKSNGWQITKSELIPSSLGIALVIGKSA